jgi:signal transduction histidine kinase
VIPDLVTDAPISSRVSLGSNEILDRLSLVGQDITASLDFEGIVAAVEQHVGVLLDATTFYIGMLDETREWIDIPVIIEGGRRSSGYRLRVDDSGRSASRAVRENRELLRETPDERALHTGPSGTAPTLTALFRPLSVRDRTIGVMSVQSARAGAYGERERLIFRSLCAYVAVALANAASFRRLAAAEAERTTTLTRLVAGIAHEVNTPLGMALTVATAFGRAAHDFQEKLSSGTLGRTDLEAFSSLASEAARQVTANLVRATDLMGEFGQIGLDRTCRPRTFNVADVIGSVITSLSLELHRRPYTLEVAVPPELELTTDPEALGRVLKHLIANVLAFAFPEGAEGTLRVEAEPSGRNEVRITISDDGTGIPDAELAVIFEPFSPTSRGSRGLGLHIAYSLAIGVLRGTLTCQTLVGRGTTFCLVIPTRVAAA